MIRSYLYIILIAFIVQSCTINYSFTGGTLHPDLKTFSVKNFPNRAPLINATLSQELTEAIKDKFSSQTRLDLIDDNGDLQFEGEITGYNTKPQSIQGNETSALNRLTITIKVKFTNLVDPSQNFENNFSGYEDYDSGKSLDQVEGQLVPQILEKLTDDLFNKSVANW